MHGKMAALEALLEMLSKMDLDRMKPEGEGKVELSVESGGEVPPETEADGNQAEVILDKQLPGDLTEKMTEDATMSHEEDASADEEELKKLYSKLG